MPLALICILLLAILLLGGCGGRGTAQRALPDYFPPPVYARPPQDRIVPAGTLVAIRTIDGIRARQPDVGQGFGAVIVSDVRGVNGDVLIQKGSPVKLVVLSRASGTGGCELALGMRWVVESGSSYLVSALNEAWLPLDDGCRPGSGSAGAGGAALGRLRGAVASAGAVRPENPPSGAVVVNGTQVVVPPLTDLTFELDETFLLGLS